jgi:hypothetical protein
MIAKVVRGRGFGGLARYLEAGKAGHNGDRVAWSEARNLPSNHPRQAALSMRATAAQNARVERPVYHLSLAWDPADGVDRAQIVAVADRLLKELELEEHQVLMVAHADTLHAHVHLMVNRVHPETARAWKGSNDYRRIEEILRPLERELGCREVPGHHGRLPGQAPPDRSQALSTGELRQWERTGERPFGELVREVAGLDFAQASSWGDLEKRLARNGLWLEARGRGMVVTDGRESLKLSAVAREASRPHLERRFGERYVEHEREPARAAEGRDGGPDAGDRRGRGGADRGRGRDADPGDSRAGDCRPRTSGREDGAGRAQADLAPSRDGGSGDGRRSARGSGTAADPALDRLKRQVEKLEEWMKPSSAGDAPRPLGVGLHDRRAQRELRHALGRSALALAPWQVQRLQEWLTTPQRALLKAAVREVRSLLLEQDRER